MAFSSLGILQIRTNFQLQYSKFRRISKVIYGTSHVISLAEAGAIFEKDAERLIIGTGDNRKAGLSDEATDILRKERSCGRHQGIEGGLYSRCKSATCEAFTPYIGRAMGCGRACGSSRTKADHRLQHRDFVRNSILAVSRMAAMKQKGQSQDWPIDKAQ